MHTKPLYPKSSVMFPGWTFLFIFISIMDSKFFRKCFQIIGEVSSSHSNLNCHNFCKNILAFIITGPIPRDRSNVCQNILFVILVSFCQLSAYLMLPSKAFPYSRDVWRVSSLSKTKKLLLVWTAIFFKLSGSFPSPNVIIVELIVSGLYVFLMLFHRERIEFVCNKIVIDIV